MSVLKTICLSATEPGGPAIPVYLVKIENRRSYLMNTSLAHQANAFLYRLRTEDSIMSEP